MKFSAGNRHVSKGSTAERSALTNVNTADNTHTQDLGSNWMQAWESKFKKEGYQRPKIGDFWHKMTVPN